MLRIIDWRGKTLDPAFLAGHVPRVELDATDVAESVQALIDDVRRHGEAALLAQAEKFDSCRPRALRVDSSELESSRKALPDSLQRSIDIAIDRVRQGSALQVPPRQSVEVAHGATITQRWKPVRRAGVYVPGGKAVYPSSVVMNVVAAQVAGVTEIALASPPQRDYDASIHPTILATASMLEVTEAYRMGGAGAIAALAYGVPEAGLEPVSVITGPGNTFVATAKRLLKGVVGIDSEAGPTEIVVIADESAPADIVASDLVSQAEHDELAQAVLITTSAKLAEEVNRSVALRADSTAHSARVNQALSGAQSAIILVDSVDAAVVVSDELAPEHLAIMTRNPHEVAESVTHAGAIFVGPYTPVSAGDYLAGSNHVLPTGGHAKFEAGLSAMTFLRPQQIVEYDRSALEQVADDIVRFAEAENLPAHGEAVTARFRQVGEG